MLQEHGKWQPHEKLSLTLEYYKIFIITGPEFRVCTVNEGLVNEHLFKMAKQSLSNTIATAGQG